ncbi:Dihydrofolate reductase type [Alteripontixanthobacter maritimus]|uniref:Dihydrofolate reductase type n=1 Tax=Alteripontixanthobacter maritimus TaxID=2161824 RepID=A0A369Q4U0_9SPHN|nr:hypothetical protein [Alteripontixanthobacter maritimus]RDC59744.1 Dihydrofolate reductase type [Alteripontixanthobacter maritimus]
MTSPTDSALVERKWALGDLVQKKRNSEWRGVVVGFYSTDATPEGYNVESLFERGSCQLWPASALIDWDGQGAPEQLAARIEALETMVRSLTASLDQITGDVANDSYEDLLDEARTLTGETP